MPNNYGKLIDQCLNMPNRLPEEILDIHGMSGHLFRSFINNLLYVVQKPRYLEIGCWKGSTAISAVYNNVENIDQYWIIDNWSEFEFSRQEFINKFSKYVGQQPNLYDVNCFIVNPSDLGINDVNIYFYDGGHTAQDHRDAITKYLDYMSDEFIFLVDDWNADIVRLPTWEAIKVLSLDVVYFKEIFTSYDEKYTWWNGCGLFVLRKK